jgi:hypothetical protein
MTGKHLRAVSAGAATDVLPMPYETRILGWVERGRAAQRPAGGLPGVW